MTGVAYYGFRESIGFWPAHAFEALITKGPIARPNPVLGRDFSADFGTDLEGLEISVTTTANEAAKARNSELPRGLAMAARNDGWIAQPIVTFLVLTGFVAYATWRVLENQYYVAEDAAAGFHLATPFGNPDLTMFVPGFLKAIPVVGMFLGYPAVLILPFVAGFRFTCYYYRKAYYRSFIASPPACSIPGTTSRNYKGEKGILAVQNIHRYFFYAALVVLAFNYWDMGRSYYTPFDSFHFGLGNVIMTLNVLFLSAYTLGCHSFRHLVGGKLDCFSCSATTRAQYGLWSRVTMLNNHHMMWAWISLFWVAGTDYFIRWAAQSGATHVMGVPI